jgi:hypothetical protein
MLLLVVRHAIAEDPAEYARQHADDDGRPLTAEGRKKMKRAARGCGASYPGSIGWPRVRSPAHCRRRRSWPQPTTASSRRPSPLWRRAAHSGTRGLARRGTPPHGRGDRGTRARAESSRQLAPGRRERSFIELKKGAACLLACADQVGAGSATCSGPCLHRSCATSNLTCPSIPPIYSRGPPRKPPVSSPLAISRTPRPPRPASRIRRRGGAA